MFTVEIKSLFSAQHSLCWLVDESHPKLESTIICSSETVATT